MQEDYFCALLGFSDQRGEIQLKMAQKDPALCSMVEGFDQPKHVWLHHPPRCY